MVSVLQNASVLLQNIWWLLVLIGVMIIIHEFGHFWAARFFGVRVEAFSIGFGPRLFGFRRGETDFRFSAIPFGGYVKMSGEQAGDDNAQDPNSFSAKPRWQRLIIAFAGPAMNIILAVALLTGLYMYQFPKRANFNTQATIGFVLKDSPAARAGLKEGDKIVQIDDIRNPQWEDVVIKEISSAGRVLTIAAERNGERVETTVTPVMEERTGLGSVGWDEQQEVQVGSLVPGMDAERKGLQKADVVISLNGVPVRSVNTLHDVVRNSGGKPIEIVYQRGDQQHKVTVQPAYSNPDGLGRWMIGVQPERRMIISQLSFPVALQESVRQNIKGASLIYQFLQGMVERRMSPKSLDGPIGIAKLSGQAARQGLTSFLELMAMVSLNLAVFNLLPIPILDGGLILLLLVEMVMRRDLSLQVKEAVLKVGMVFLMAVVVFVLYNDISKLIPG